MEKVEPGRYQHYKGGLYEVLGECIFTETLEEVVLYIQLHNNNPKFPIGTLWARPKRMFLEKVLIDGKEIPRFKKIMEMAPPE